MVSSTQPSAAPETAPARFVLLRQLLSQPGGVVGGIILLLLVSGALFAPWLTAADPFATSEQLLLPPFWLDGGSLQHPLGSDDLGRDLMARLFFGGRLSLMVGLCAVLGAALGAVPLGLWAGLRGGWVDGAAMRLADILLALPSLLLAIAIVAILGPGLDHAILALAIVLFPHLLRVTRGAVLAEVHKDYVVAARMCGAGPCYLMGRTLLPNCLSPIVVQATLGISSSILDAAALGFLGLGAQPPQPEWGTMLATTIRSGLLLQAWWLMLFPGLAILLVVMGLNLLGDALRDALDPALRRL